MLGYTLTTVVMTCWRGWSIGPHPPSGWPHPQHILAPSPSYGMSHRPSGTSQGRWYDPA